MSEDLRNNRMIDMNKQSAMVKDTRMMYIRRDDVRAKSEREVVGERLTLSGGQRRKRDVTI